MPAPRSARAFSFSSDISTSRNPERRGFPFPRPDDTLEGAIPACPPCYWHQPPPGRGRGARAFRPHATRGERLARASQGRRTLRSPPFHMQSLRALLYGDEVREASFLEFTRSRGAGGQIHSIDGMGSQRPGTSLPSPPASIPKYSARPRSWVRCGGPSISLVRPARPLARWTWFFHRRSPLGGGSGATLLGRIRRP